MWKIYSSDYMKNNRACSYSIMAASFIAAVFLSFLCSLFYNFWLDSIQNGKKEPPLVLLSFYAIVVMLLCISLILVIHNSFAVSMQNRIHQFGILSSVGATPGQIRLCLLQEAFMLSACPILAGVLSGILSGFGTVHAMGAFAENLAGGRSMDFALHPAILVVILVMSFLTVLISAWIPARKLGRLTPLEAIRGNGELQLAKKKRSRLLSALFGVEGELAGNALRAQKKALRTTTLSLTLAFLGYMLMQCFFTLSGISTEHTYFEAYQDAWDVMVTVRGTRIEEFEQISEIQKMQGMESCIVYQKAEAFGFIPADDISSELQGKGGLEALAGISLSAEKTGYQIEAPIVILDDASFEEYCRQIGIEPQLNGTVVLNRIWDSVNSNFRYREYLPYIKSDIEQITFYSIAGTEEETADVTIVMPVLACSERAPVLREEYRNYALVQFMPLSLWREVAGQVGGAETDLSIRILAKDRTTPEALDRLEKDIIQIIGKEYEAESENRIQEKKDNDTMIWGYKIILGGLCGLFALIGIANMFSNTLGFLSQRKREFARYMSVGLTPQGIRKIFCIEAAALIGRPLLFTAILTIVATACMIKVSYLKPMEFIKAAPVGPIMAFVLAVLGFTALAYYLGGRKILQINPADALRDDTML